MVLLPPKQLGYNSIGFIAKPAQKPKWSVIC